MNVRHVTKWTISILLVLVVVAFLAFLYLIPPFTVVSPETFSGPETAAARRNQRVFGRRRRRHHTKANHTASSASADAISTMTSKDQCTMFTGGRSSAFTVLRPLISVSALPPVRNDPRSGILIAYSMLALSSWPFPGR